MIFFVSFVQLPVKEDFLCKKIKIWPKILYKDQWTLDNIFHRTFDPYKTRKYNNSMLLFWQIHFKLTEALINK